MRTVGILGSGEAVLDRHVSHVHDDVKAILPLALSQVSLSGESFATVQVDFEFEVGQTVCVSTTDAGEIIFAQRPRRAGLTRFVKNRQAEPCRSVCVILKKAEDRQDVYILITAFIGKCPGPEPWDRNATEKSKAFWATHALVWGSEEIIPGTETTDCPW